MDCLLRVKTTQLFSFILLIFAFVGIIVSSIASDWQRSIALQITHLQPWKNQGFHNHDLTLIQCFQCPSRKTLFPSGSNRSKSKNAFRLNQMNGRDKALQWKLIGFKGLWKECVHVPISKLVIIKQPDVDFKMKSIPVSSNEVKMKGRYSTSKLPRSEKKCSNITLGRVSCLLLGIRAMMLLGISCGAISMILAFASMFFDKQIRILTQQPRFDGYKLVYRNPMTVLAGMIASLSGALSLTGCWWYTLKSNSHFFVPSFQNQHDENGAIFVYGSSLHVAVGSGITFLLIGILFAYDNSLNSKTRSKLLSHFICKKNSSVLLPNRDVWQTQC